MQQQPKRLTVFAEKHRRIYVRYFEFTNGEGTKVSQFNEREFSNSRNIKLNVQVSTNSRIVFRISGIRGQFFTSHEFTNNIFFFHESQTE